MKRTILLLLILLGVTLKTQAQIDKLVVNKYWQYTHSFYQQDKTTVYNFSAVPRDSVKEIAMYFEPGGSFREVVTKKHPKPARKGKWHTEGQTLVIEFSGDEKNPRWMYKILYMDAGKFQCTMGK